MFRIKKSDVPPSLGATAWVVVGLTALAWAAGVSVAVRALAGAPAPPALAAAPPLLLAPAAAGFVWLWRRTAASQESLRRVKLLAHDILASMDQGVVTTDDRGLVTSVNTAALRLLGADGECVGAPVGRLAPADLPLDELSRRVIDRHEHLREQEYNVPRDGPARRLLLSAHGLTGGDGRTDGCVFHLRDVTERMRMKEQVWRLQRLAHLSTLATGLHHEIKNPLTALSLHVQLVEERLRATRPGGSDPDPLDELVGVLKAEVRRLNGVLERFRNFASLERLSLRPTDAVGVLRDVARLFAPQAERQGVRLRLEAPAAPVPPVPLDEEKFREAVLNLVVNALEAMPAGGDLTLAARPADGALVVEVGDTGPGIPDEVRADLFAPYVTTKPHGTGMGLALTEKLIGQHGGSVTFQTGPGGTVFRLTLPGTASPPAVGVVATAAAAAGAGR